MATTTISIWKDYDSNLGSTDGTLFRFKVGGNVIYQGTGVRRPGAANVLVRVNGICADWINHIPDLSNTDFQSLTFPVTFTIEKSSDGSTWTEVEKVKVINDWSYDYNYDPATYGFAQPITGRITYDKPISFTPYGNYESLNVVCHRKDGTDVTHSVNVAIVTARLAPLSDFGKALQSSGSCGSMFFLLGDIDSYPAQVKSFTVQGHTFEVVDADCANYVLYYLNPYGGWDFLLVEGETVPGDTLTRYTRKVEYKNNLVGNRGEQNYVNEVARRFTLHTGPLMSDQSLRLRYLLTSPQVYLCSDSYTYLPVIIEGTDFDYRTVRQNGQQLVDYAIGVRVAQQFQRR